MATAYLDWGGGVVGWEKVVSLGGDQAPTAHWRNVRGNQEDDPAEWERKPWAVIGTYIYSILYSV